jgi:hypothetical protein
MKGNPVRAHEVRENRERKYQALCKKEGLKKKKLNTDGALMTVFWEFKNY